MYRRVGSLPYFYSGSREDHGFGYQIEGVDAELNCSYGILFDKDHEKDIVIDHYYCIGFRFYKGSYFPYENATISPYGLGIRSASLLSWVFLHYHTYYSLFDPTSALCVQRYVYPWVLNRIQEDSIENRTTAFSVLEEDLYYELRSLRVPLGFATYVSSVCSHLVAVGFIEQGSRNGYAVYYSVGMKT